MSASDCDGSLDWRSTGHEERGSLLNQGYEQAALERTFPSTHPWPCESHSSTALKEEGDSAPSSSTESCDRDSDGLLPLGLREQSASLSLSLPNTTVGEKSRQAHKRQRGATTLHSTPEWTDERDKLFAHKCSQLQCYIPPLSSILNGLRSGRYRERLSTFQESVAMDRIQRIMGVLQNRCTGERYISIVLKVEEMLKNWFPDIKPREQDAVEQDRISPSKKQKLTATALPIMAANPVPPGAFPPTATETALPGAYSATHTKWLHTSPICSPTVELTLGRLPPCDKDVTQDNAVSSSTDAKPITLAARPPLGKINAPCLERLLKSTDSIITCRSTGGSKDSSWL
ncbi:circadian-associated transcriptional repressor-like [Arapaima gigas]